MVQQFLADCVRIRLQFFLWDKVPQDLLFYAYIIPFLISTVGGAVISAVLLYSLKKSNVLYTMQESIQ